MATNKVVNVKDSSVIVDKLVKQLTGKIPAEANDLADIMSWGAKELEELDQDSRDIITSTLSTLVTEQEVLGAFIPASEINLIKSTGPYNTRGGIKQKLRINMPKPESDDVVYNPSETTDTTSALFGKTEMQIQVMYWYKPFAHGYSYTIGDEWFTGLVLSGNTIGDIYAEMQNQLYHALELEQEAQSLAALRSSMLLNLGSVEDIGSVGTPRAVNLLAMFKEATGSTLVAKDALDDPAFLRYAGRIMDVTSRKLKRPSQLYNEMGFLTGASSLDSYFNSEFVSAYSRNYVSETYHDKLVKITGDVKEITAWQDMVSASNTSDFATTTTVKDTITVPWAENAVTVDMPYVLGTVLDSRRIGIQNWGVKRTSQKDAKAMTENIFYHVFGAIECDPFYNSVTFYMADPVV